jgi:diguanylate cyclase (GGDEF)-like protein
LPRRRVSAAARARLLLDGVMVVLVAVTFSWYFVLGPIVQSTGGTTLAKIVSFAYPFGDLLMICCLLLLLSPLNGTSRRAGALLAGSLGVMIVADSVFALQVANDSYTFGGFLDLAWAIGHGVAAIAMRWERHDEVAVSVAPQQAAVSTLYWTLAPYLFLPAVAVLLAYTYFNAGDPWLERGVYATAGVLIAVIALRQVLVITDNWHLQRITAANGENLTRLNAELGRARDALLATNGELVAAKTRWETLATTDPLTSLPNHRALSATFDAEIARSVRHDTPCAVLFFDLDHFKALNDSYGHPTGDAVLREFATVARGALRTEDHLGRWGGEEFVALLPECDLDGALLVAERLREAVMHHTFIAGGGLHLTCSIGVACAPADGIERDQLLDQADRAMYVAKERGRNRVCGTRALRYAAVRASEDDRSREATSLDGLVDGLALLLSARDSQVRGRDDAVATLIGKLARELGIEPSEAKMIGLAGRLRDVGAMAISDTVLHKPDRLTGDEWARVQLHSTIGADMLARIPALRAIAPLVRAHHERWDGQGYPHGLAGEAIPLGARIIAVADAFVAMTTARPFRPAREGADALAELDRCAGTQFDPLIVALLHAVSADDSERGLVSAITALTRPVDPDEHPLPLISH